VAGLVTTFGSGAMTNSIKEIDGAATLFVIGAERRPSSSSAPTPPAPTP